MKKYKLVRRGPKYCVRVNGILNTTDCCNWCRERNMSYHIKQHWHKKREDAHFRQVHAWDYDFIFDKASEATAFMIGYL